MKYGKRKWPGLIPLIVVWIKTYIQILKDKVPKLKRIDINVFNRQHLFCVYLFSFKYLIALRVIRVLQNHMIPWLVSFFLFVTNPMTRIVDRQFDIMGTGLKAAWELVKTRMVERLIDVVVVGYNYVQEARFEIWLTANRCSMFKSEESQSPSGTFHDHNNGDEEKVNL